MPAIFPVLFSLDWWASWSSIVGFLLTIASVIGSIVAAGRARKAQLAAEAAAKSVRHRDTADELGLLVALAAQMSQFVEVNDGRGASLRASDVLEKLVALQNRRLPFLNGEGDRIDLIKDQLSSISKSLATNGVPTDTANRKKLFGRCQSTHKCPHGELGWNLFDRMRKLQLPSRRIYAQLVRFVVRSKTNHRSVATGIQCELPSQGSGR